MSSAYAKGHTSWEHGGCVNRRMSTRGRTRSTSGAVLVVVSAALLGGLVAQWLTPSSSSATAPLAAPPVAPRPHERLQGDHHDALGEADGFVPDGVTVFDVEFPAVAKLDPELLRALRQAATQAAGAGVTFTVQSGWRSPAYQEQLLREAVSEYGSREEAARWVATPETSLHVSGHAVDLGPAGTTAWLSKHGAAFGLCRIYRNEPWHYELRPDAPDHGCPAMYADPTRDPRMH